jgi:hypothetical protein
VKNGLGQAEQTSPNINSSKFIISLNNHPPQLPAGGSFFFLDKIETRRNQG